MRTLYNLRTIYVNILITKINNNVINAYKL